MIFLEVIFVVIMLLWLLTFFPPPGGVSYPNGAGSILAWIAVADLGVALYLFHGLAALR